MTRSISAVLSAAVITGLALTGCQGSILSAAAHRSGGENPGQGWEAQGQVKIHNHDDWCLTASQSPVAYDPVYVAPCVENDARQVWHLARVNSAGQITLSAYALSVGQRGALDTARLVNVHTSNPRTEQSIVTFTEVQGGEWWTIGLPQFRGGTLLTAPVRLNKRSYVYPLAWKSPQAPSQSNQDWDLPVFQPVE